MVLLLHITIALTSIVYTTYLSLRPSRSKLHVAYGLVTATVASGTYLALTTHSSIRQACQAGLLYLGVSAAGLLVARHRLVVHVRGDDRLSD